MLNKKNIPNLITVMRGVLTLIIIFLFLSQIQNKFLIIYILFLIAALSDYIDGFLARRWGMVSDFGKMFDPLFDKILTLSLYFFLFNISGLPKLIFILLFLRELIIDGMKNYMLAKGIVTPAIFSAKLKTVCQIFMLNFALLYLILPNTVWLGTAAYIFGALAVFFAYYSGLIYARKFINSFNGKDTKDEPKL